jgi:hypothetical protein
MTANLYATDGKCHNTNRGTYGHECGKPATWIGTKADGFAMGFCDRCKQSGDEAPHFPSWRTAPPYMRALATAIMFEALYQFWRIGKDAQALPSGRSATPYDWRQAFVSQLGNPRPY